MPYVYQDSKPRPPALPGAARTTHSSGKTYEELKQECLHRGVLFEDPDFPACNSSLFFSERTPVPFIWKRPGDIVKDPKFILGGATRTDICQGDLGDCWLLAAIASLTLNEKTLARVVPLDQDFGPDYAGIFHFQFWQHNEWLDVVIDDRLPTFKGRLVFLHSAERNEFWSALLEKAYAKLNGSYEALKGGSTIEAMEDFTGGVGEMYEVKKAPDNFYEILEKALKRCSMVGCSIDTSSAAESEAKTPFGLIKGHAYSVTGISEVSYRGRQVQLIRIRNPWGNVEWNGPWSDKMKFEDFKVHFDKVEICNLTPDALEDSTAHKWEVTIHQGSWVRGSTAGGCRNFLETFWTNPQIKLHLTEKDDGQDDCTFIAALMQKDRRKLKKLGAEMLTIGYSIYENPGRDGHLGKDFFRYHPSKARSKTYINLREVSNRFKLPPGDYILVPTTFEPHQEADFCLRIFSEKKAITEDLDENVAIDLPEPLNPSPSPQETEEEKLFQALFEQISGKDMEIAAEELKYVLNAVLQKTKNIKFKNLSLISCRNIISLMDTSGNGKLEFNEFKIFWEKMKKWINIFLQFDFDKSGSMSSYELRSALKAAGYQLNNYLLQLVVLRYSDEQLQIEFDDFLNCLIRLENASRVFQALSVKNKEFINLNIGEFINLAMNI
ncbi:calpain-9 isoform X2 [Falco rusticolus]|uniref:calpain-9 isoform X2 n=1 Tax=Falco rusticolus TaxID=120794 RepID=UPI000386FC41|nr:calpain-9 isoform X2 [Falco rusticolus]XP_055666517.1 calpain-9 isoform X2 [Falco peregrinus]